MRSQQKADRRLQILAAASQLFAEHGFRSISIEDLGAAVGVSGPAIYRHFPGKEAILAELLVGVSQRLLDGGTIEATHPGSPGEALRRLIRFHTDFALRDRNLIRIQDRDLTQLSRDDQHLVRRLQRSYVDVWVASLVNFDPTLSPSAARTKVHAAFGLLNSTPYSAAERDGEMTRTILEQMTIMALMGTSQYEIPVERTGMY